MHGVIRKVLVFLSSLLVFVASNIIVGVLASFVIGVPYGYIVGIAFGLYLSIITYKKFSIRKDTVPNKAKKNASLPSNHSNYFLKHWYGEHSIARSFWINYILLGLVIGFIFGFVFGFNDISFTENPSLAAFSYIATWVLISLLAIWQLVGLWRSGGNSREYLNSNWGTGTQILAVFFFLGFTAQLFLNVAPQVKDYWLIGTGKDPWGQYQLRVLRDATELEFSGYIGFGATNKIEEYLVSHPAIEIIHLNSDGGRVEEARKLASLIERQGLSTYTSLGCSSACIIPYAAGKERLININASLGFHQYHHAGFADQSVFDYDYYIDKKYLISKGINDEFLENIFDTPPNEIWVPSHEELFQANFITRYPNYDDVAITDFGIADLNRVIEEQWLNEIKKENPVGYNKIIWTLRSAVEKGHSISDVRKEILPVIFQTFQQRIPYTSDEALLGYFQLELEIYRYYESTNPQKCYEYDQGTIVDLSDLPQEFVLRQWDSVSRVITEQKDIQLPSEDEVASLLAEAYSNLEKKYGDDIELFNKANLTLVEQSKYCSMSISLYEEILEASAEQSILALRLLSKGI